MTRETVFFETPARRAMSVMVSLARFLTRFARGDSRADFRAPLTERLDVLTRLLIGSSSLRHRRSCLPYLHKFRFRLGYLYDTGYRRAASASGGQRPGCPARS